MQTLVDWNTSNKKQAFSPDADVGRLEAAMKRVLDSAAELKNVQEDLQSTIDSMRSQYFRLMEAKDKNKFMEDNKYIKYELLELEELLVQSGFIDPDEAVGSLADQAFPMRMERASKIFYDYVSAYSPEMMSPQYQPFIEAATKPKNSASFFESTNDKINVTSLSRCI